ncbi:MAG: sulfite exporter TauE/SafE family protein [Syntrophales bacterium]|jgi:uncharacterized membrane protein YfcA|nr:sulfite exporter TauE/SafE family protein [Syntrophales bacterium]MDY0044890.1 sulfite exporter TauE/SafE family protein [Syntrophales bacterium]
MALISILTLAASCIGTATGFGMSTIMMPVLALYMPMSVALLFAGILHFCGDIWKVLFFRGRIDWKLILGFGIAGIIASYAGASLSIHLQTLPLKKILGAFLIMYVIFLFFNRDWAMPNTSGTALLGGSLSGLFAGFFGVGGAVRSAFLTAFNLPKEMYIFTSGIIALLIDITRISRYISGGTRLESYLLYTLLISIPFSLLGAFIAKKFISRLPQKYFRNLVGVFLAIIGILLIFSF